MPNKWLPVLLIVVVIAAAAGAGFYFMTRGESPDAAVAALAAQNIEATDDNFIAEINAGHSDNIRQFIMAGKNAGTQDHDGTSALMAAITSGNNDIITTVMATLPPAAVQTAAIINLQDSAGNTALIKATEINNAAIATQLIEKGADAAIANHALETPLIIAIKHDYKALVYTLLNANSAQTVNSPDASGDAPIIDAIRQQDTDIVKLLITAKADCISADLRGTTPLMIAAETGNQAIADLLLKAGANPNVADKFGNTPLSIALAHGHPDFAIFLFHAGADADFHTTGPLPLQLAAQSTPFNAELVGYILAHSTHVNEAIAPLLFAVVNQKNTGLLNTLLAKNANPNISDAQGETLLYHAIEAGDENNVISLIDKGADIHQTGITGITPLERAVTHNESQVVQKLLTMGISPNEKTNEGYTIAEMAVYRGYPETLQVLLDKGATLQKDFGLLWSIRDGGGKCVGILLAHGASPSIANGNGEPALWLAASANETNAVQALIDHHALLDVPDKQGMTPLAIASHNGQLASVKLLVTAGAKMEAKDKFGMTPLAHAAYMSKPDVVEFLISKGADTNTKDLQKRSVIDLAGLASASEARDKVMALLQKK